MIPVKEMEKHKLKAISPDKIKDNKKNISSKPKLARKDYLTYYKEDIILVSCQGYIGRGASIKKHPMKGSIYYKKCRNCGSEDINLIFIEWVMPATVLSYKYEFFCNVCKKYSQYEEYDA